MGHQLLLKAIAGLALPEHSWTDIESDVIAEPRKGLTTRNLKYEITVLTHKTPNASIIDHNTMHISRVPCTRQQETGTRLRIDHVLPKRLDDVSRHHRGRLQSEIMRLVAEPCSVLLPIGMGSSLG